MSIEKLLKKSVKVKASEWEQRMMALLNRSRDRFLTESFLLIHMDVQALNLEELLKILVAGDYKVYLGRLDYIHRASRAYMTNLDMMLTYMFHRDEYEYFLVDGETPFMVKKDKLKEIKRRWEDAKSMYG